MPGTLGLVDFKLEGSSSLKKGVVRLKTDTREKSLFVVKVQTITVLMGHSQFNSLNSLIFTHAWLNL
jgi:hypothetical protein